MGGENGCNSRLLPIPSPTIIQEKIHVSSIQGFLEDLTINQTMLSTVCLSQ